MISVSRMWLVHWRETILQGRRLISETSSVPQILFNGTLVLGDVHWECVKKGSHDQLWFGNIKLSTDKRFIISIILLLLQNFLSNSVHLCASWISKLGERYVVFSKHDWPWNHVPSLLLVNCQFYIWHSWILSRASISVDFLNWASMRN